MSLFTNPIRPAPIASDAAVRRYIEAIRRQVEPDPLYRRRLRGQLVNRFVARKRGMDLTGPRRPSRMGALGRACLYASFALAVSVTGVMAASDAAIPGDVLYPLKLRIEEMRLDVLPDEYDDELTAYVLSERIGELSQLVEAGDVARASALAGSIRDAYEGALAESDDPAQLALRLDWQVAWLAQVVSGLPERAQAAIEHAMAGAPGLMLNTWEPTESGAGVQPATAAGDEDGSSQGGGTNSGSATGGPDDDPSQNATPSTEPSPKPDRTPKPNPNPSEHEIGAPSQSQDAPGNEHSPAP